MSRCCLVILPVALVLCASVAHAQDGVSLEERMSTPTSYDSSQHFWFEFKLGPYIPGIDKEFGGSATPYNDIFGYDGKDNNKAVKPFGDGRNMMFTWELDYEIWRKFGTIAVGGSVGYFTNSAPAIIVVSGQEPDKNADRSGSTSTINLVPLALLAIYRFDLLADRYKIPFVPYVKFGINYTFWWMQVDGDVRRYTDSAGNVFTAKGGTWGWQTNVGAAIRLDIIDPSASRTLDNETGINHTYIFFEMAHIAADGLGSGSALRVGDTTWNGGLAFEF